MKVDILLISYNQEDFIAQAVESILMQRVKDDVSLRVVVADDSSTDSTLKIIKSIDERQYEFVNKCESIRTRLVLEFVYIDSNKNVGISKNYQRAFEKCNADYIAVLEGDDYWSSPYHIEQHIRFLDKHRECSMSMNSIVGLIQEPREFILSKWKYSDPIIYVDTKRQISDGNQLGNLSACVFRGSCISALPKDLYNMPIADWMLGVMLSQQGLLAIMKESTSVYRINSNGQWSSLTSAEKINQLLLCSKMYDDFQNGIFHNYWETYRRKLRISINDFFPPIVISLFTFLKKIIKHIYPPVIKKVIRKIYAR